MASLRIVQLSDIHFRGRDETNIPTDVLDAAIAAIRSECAGTDNVLVVYNGDLAHSGKSEEFDQAADLVCKIRQAITENPSIEGYAELFVPGNHDCDFTQDDRLRKRLVQDRDKLNELEGSEVDKLLCVQRGFRDFVQKLRKTSQYEILACKSLFLDKVIQIGSLRIRAFLVNSAWAATRDDRQGSVCLPDDIHPQCVAEDRVDLAIAAMHHPYVWFDQDTRANTLNQIEAKVSICLTGHEHVSDSYLKRRSDSASTIWLEAQALWDSDGQKPAFQIAMVDLELRSVAISLREYIDGQFCKGKASTSLPLRVESTTVSSVLNFTREFRTMLDDPGCTIKHPELSRIKLKDLYVYPSLRRRSKTGKRRWIDIKGAEASEKLAEYDRLVITGGEKRGKSALAKMLTYDLWSSGRYPLLLFPSGRVPARGERCRDFLRTAADRVYEEGADEYFAVPREHRVLIIDDFHELQYKGGSEDDFLQAAHSLFGQVILVSWPELELVEMLSQGRGDLILGEYEHFEIRELGHVDRSRLVVKWERARGMHDRNQFEFRQECTRKENALTLLLGRNLLPHVPLFALILLTHIEENIDPEGDRATLGRLYDMMISGHLLEHANSDITDTDMANCLSEFAYWLFFDRSWDQALYPDVVEWMEKYRAEWNASYEAEQMLKRLQHAGLLERINDQLRFRYPYQFHFFAAKGLTRRLDEGLTKADSQVRDLSGRLFDDAAAQIMVFLCYLSRNPIIIESIIVRATQVFPEEKEFRLDERPELFRWMSEELPQMELLEGTPAEVRTKVLEHADKCKEDLEAADSHEIVIETAAGFVDDYRASYMAVHLGGQILRSFGGTITGERQEELMRACYGAGLRAVSALVRLFETHSERISAELARVVMSEHEGLATHEVIASITGRIANVIEGAAFGIIKETGNATGNRRLAVTMKRVVENAENVSYRVIGMSTRLDHYPDYPEGEIQTVWKQVRGAFLAQSVVRDILWLDFHLYERDYRAVQKICKLVDIKVPGHKFLDQSTKVRRGG